MEKRLLLFRNLAGLLLRCFWSCRRCFREEVLTSKCHVQPFLKWGISSIFRSSILERCILKMSTASVAVGTEDIDGIKRSGKCFLVYK